MCVCFIIPGVLGQLSSELQIMPYPTVLLGVVTCGQLFPLRTAAGGKKNWQDKDINLQCIAPHWTLCVSCYLMIIVYPFMLHCELGSNFTHRHHSERCVDDTRSNSGIHRLRYTSCLKDAGGKVKDLHKQTPSSAETYKHHYVETLKTRFNILLIWLKLSLAKI